jgi:hypothetical protein
MKINGILRCTALLLVLSMFGQSMAFARKPLGSPVIREKVAAIGEGQQCRVKLVDGTQVKGMIISIHADDLTLKTEGVQVPRRIDYAQINSIQKSGISGNAKLGIGIGVLVALLFWFMSEFSG